METMLGLHVGSWDYATLVAIFVSVITAPSVAESILSVSASAPRLRRIALTFLLGGMLACLPARGHAAALDCPETGAGAVSNLLTERDLSSSPAFRLG
jgi:hypothetical protein